MPVTETPFNAALRLAPVPVDRDDATRHEWVKHYAAVGLAAYATLRAEERTVPANPTPGSRPEIGYLSMLGASATAAAAALLGPIDAPGRLWDLNPAAGAWNGEHEEWLADVLVRYGINPADIDPDLVAADFAKALVSR